MLRGLGNRIGALAAVLASAVVLSGCGVGAGSTGPGGTPATLTIITTSLPNGTTGTTYSANLTAGGGTSPYTWSLASGSTLPSGLTMTPDGAISGTPTTAGTTNITFTVSDSEATPQSQSKQLSLVVAAGFSITTGSLPSGIVNTSYSATLSATGGTLPYAWTLSSGSLPAGLSLSSYTGTISGTPLNTGVATFTVTVSDSHAATAHTQFSISVGASGTITVTITTPSGGSATVSLGGTQQLVVSVTGTANTAVSWSVAGITNGNSALGTITGGSADTVTYNAPAAMPSTNPVTVTAISQADSTQSASATITLAPATSHANAVVATGTQTTRGINFSFPSSTPTLGLADVGTCTGTLNPLNVNCGTSVTGISAAPGATVIVWVLGQGLTTGSGTNMSLANGLAVNVTQGSTSDIAVSNLSAQPSQNGLSSIYFQIQVSPNAKVGLRDIVVTNSTGELQHFVGALQITSGP